MPIGEPQLPVRVAEMLYVAFSATLDDLSGSDYEPAKVDNMRKICEAYDRDRTKTMKARGLNDTHVQKYTDAACVTLAKWLDDKAARSERAEGDFDEWSRELGDDHPEGRGGLRP